MLLLSLDSTRLDSTLCPAGLHRLVAKVTLYEADTLTPCTQMNKPWEMRCVSERDSEVREVVSRKVRDEGVSQPALLGLEGLMRLSVWTRATQVAGP